MPTATTVLPARVPTRLLSRKAVVVGSMSVLVVASAGGAYAAWQASGSGSSQARSSSAQTLTLTVSATTPDLYPGGSGTVSFSVTNPNPYPVTLTTVTFGAVTSDDSVSCPASNVTTSNKTGLALAVPAGSTGTVLSVPNAVAMLAAAPNGCQARTFTIATTVSGTSS